MELIQKILEWERGILPMALTMAPFIFVEIILLPIFFLVIQTVEENPGAVIFSIIALVLPVVVGIFFGAGIEFFLSVILSILSFLGVGEVSRNWNVKDIAEGLKIFLPIGLFGAVWFIFVIITFPFWAPIVAVLIALGFLAIALVIAVVILGMLFWLCSLPFELIKKLHAKVRSHRINKRINLRAYDLGLDEAGHPIKSLTLTKVRSK